MTLRPYQADAVNAAIEWIKKCTDPGVIEAPTAAGKSWIIADIAHWVYRTSKKKVLVLAPSKELVEHDYNKYLHTGKRASIFSASLNRKEMIHPVVFGTPLTVKGALKRFNNRFACVIIDEADLITPTVKSILVRMREANPNLRIIGLTATPHRLGTGYIYSRDVDGSLMEEAKDPFFHRLIYTIEASLLIAQGWMTPPYLEGVDTQYDTSGLKLKSTGEWDSETVDKAFLGHGRKTSKIVADIVVKSRNRRGILIFASTIRHAKEILASLPPEISRMVTGDSPDRKAIISQFLKQRIKYLVNVQVLTVGFDAPHADVIAIMRATESPRLLQQIVGRGLRLYPQKQNCLVLDYAENLKRHCPDGDIFNPTIKVKADTETVPIKAECPKCETINNFSARPNPDNFKVHKHGYFLDTLGKPIDTDYGYMPSHYGRRCTAEYIELGQHQRCAFKWTYKECPECETENDIAARQCRKCKAEIVDPNEKLRIMAEQLAKDPHRVRYAKILDMSFDLWEKPGRPDTLRVEIKIDQTPKQFYQWIAPNWPGWASLFRGKFKTIEEALKGDFTVPNKVAFRKKPKTKFWDVVAYE